MNDESTKSGRQFWRSLEELAESPEFLKTLEREFPENATELIDPVSRRSFIKLMAASFALGGLSACSRTQSLEKIVPFVKDPRPELLPGKSLYFATAATIGSEVLGLLVESQNGRPIKIEGNPDHPWTLGRSSPFLQALLLEFYDPDRAQTVRHGGQVSTWDAFVLDWKKHSATLGKGEGFRVLSAPLQSPTERQERRELEQRYPALRWYEWDSLLGENPRRASELYFGQNLEAVPRFEKARIVLSLDADFLQPGFPGQIRHAWHFMQKRRTRSDISPRSMNRLYMLESSFTNTGACADHRLPLRAVEIEQTVERLARDLGLLPGEAQLPPAVPKKWYEVLLRDLRSAPGEALVVAGAHLSPRTLALVSGINERLGAFGKCLDHYSRPSSGSLSDLAQELNQGKVQALVLLGVNPVHLASPEQNWSQALKKLPFTAHLGLYTDESAQLCQWQLPQSHVLESWGDAEAVDGTTSLVQPLMQPLYQGRSVIEVLELLGGGSRSGLDRVKSFWRTQAGIDFENEWNESLRLGLVRGRSRAPLQAKPLENFAPRLPAPRVPGSGETLEAVLRLDPTMLDGRFANNGWLQETPKPLTTLTWDNVALLSPAQAAKLFVKSGDVVELSRGTQKLEAPVYVLPGHPEGSLTLHLGYGREVVGRVGEGAGFNAARLFSSEQDPVLSDVRVRPLGKRQLLAATQLHHTIEQGDRRKIVRSLAVATYLAQAPAEDEIPASLYAQAPDDARKTGYEWGMVIDQSLCVGCQACVTGCVAENNIPVVGREQVAVGREMHWIRVDTYFQGPPERPEGVHFQPLTCMHCEKAPCEPVCPVNASVHDAEGISEMVYNRCVGTRFCSNNCPYKVRRFNFLEYQDRRSPLKELMRNPDVSVRTRGVMEKCTYCIQRIEGARIEAKKELRPIREGEVVTACQQACPTNAIVFGNIADPQSQVTERRGQKGHYGVLAETGTRPRTTYLPRLKNPHPELGHG